MPPEVSHSASTILHEGAVDAIIVVCAVLGILFAIYCVWTIRKVKVLLTEGVPLLRTSAPIPETPINMEISPDNRFKIAEISEAIAVGARAFLFAEYKIMALFMIVMFCVILILIGTASDGLWPKKDGCPYSEAGCRWFDAFLSGIAFLIGGTTSIICGYIGMTIAVYTNSRTAIMAQQGIGEAFAIALHGGCVMGFALTATGILALFITVYMYKQYYTTGISEADQHIATRALFSAVAPFGLGGSSIALFGRVGGGIFTKAADVGADLVGKVEENIPEDDPRNPGVIADNVGDNVGDIAGMGSDLFGSFGEATCATFVVASTSPELLSNFSAMLLPLVILATGLVVSMLTTFLSTHIRPPTDKASVEPSLKLQLYVSTFVMTAVAAIVCYLVLPSVFHMDIVYLMYPNRDIYWWHALLSICTGLWSGLLIGLVTDYYTSNAHTPVVEVAQSCRKGPAPNIIYGLALGYKSSVIPCFAMATSVFISFLMAGTYGVALAAIGILSTMATGLAIDGYGPISDNAGGIAEMAHMAREVRARTDALDAAGNTTAAIGKGFAIGSAAFVAIALYGAFLTQVNKGQEYRIIVNILDPRTFFGLLIGAMLPYWFSALTMKSVGTAAMEMVEEIRRQFREIDGLREGRLDALPDYRACVSIATKASLKEMILPGIIVVATPIITGIFLGQECLAGLLPGSVASGVLMATSAANTGGAWDNAKKYIESGALENARKGSKEHEAAVVGDTVGDPLKDTSGPALNILVKLMAIISVVFAPVFVKGSPLAGLLFDRAICSITIDLNGVPSVICPDYSNLIPPAAPAPVFFPPPPPIAVPAPPPAPRL